MSRAVSPTPGIAPCIARATSRAVCRPRNELRHVTRATSCVVCRLRHVSRHELRRVAWAMCRAVSPTPGVAGGGGGGAQGLALARTGWRGAWRCGVTCGLSMWGGAVRGGACTARGVRLWVEGLGM